MNDYSNWLVYEGKKGARFNHTYSRDFIKNDDRKLTPTELERLNEVRDWTYEFFQNNSIKAVSWCNELVEPADLK